MRINGEPDPDDAQEFAKTQRPGEMVAQGDEPDVHWEWEHGFWQGMFAAWDHGRWEDHEGDGHAGEEEHHEEGGEE